MRRLTLWALILCGCASPPVPRATPAAAPITASPTPAVFTVPNKQARQAALGDLGDVPPGQRKYFSGQGFREIESPQPRDWLSEHPDEGQTYAQFRSKADPRPGRRRIYLRAIGPMQLEDLKLYTEAFFDCPVTVLPAWDRKARKLKMRVDIISHLSQMFAPDVLARLTPELPTDGLCLLAVTNEDLYPEDSMSYVFGLASPKDGVGIYSFARYDPRFFEDPRPPDWEKLRLIRSCKVLAHETCHMLGMGHCIYFNCVMNGVNHLDELDSRSFFLCPICLHKLQHRLQLDPGKRYRRIEDFCRSEGLKLEADWVRRRIR